MHMDSGASSILNIMPMAVLDIHKEDSDKNGSCNQSKSSANFIAPNLNDSH